MKKLDRLDKKILCKLDLDCRIPASRIAKSLNVSKETVNFRIRRLIKNNYIKSFYPIIDTGLINKFFFKVFIKFKELHPERKNQILNYISKINNVAQVLVLEGKYDAQLFYLASNHKELFQLMEKINSFCGKEIKEKESMIVKSLHRFNLKLYNDQKEDIEITSKDNDKNYKLDQISLNILKQVTEDAKRPILEIAKNLDISPQLAQYHLRKLIKDKVILSKNIAINYKLLNKQHYHITIQVNDHKVIPKLIEFFKSTKKSIFATKMIGAYDISSELMVKDNKELRETLDKLNQQFHNEINIIDVLLIFDEFQMNLYPL